jgi:hypothetical protein
MVMIIKWFMVGLIIICSYSAFSAEPVNTEVKPVVKLRPATAPSTAVIRMRATPTIRELTPQTGTVEAKRPLGAVKTQVD